MALAPAGDDSAATITLFAPGATEGAPVAVQYGDEAGNWFNVDGWKGSLDNTDGAGVPFTIRTVLAANFGQGPFRWVVFNMDGTNLWGTSDTFNLPPGGGINQTETMSK